MCSTKHHATVQMVIEMSMVQVVIVMSRVKVEIGACGDLGYLQCRRRALTLYPECRRRGGAPRRRGRWSTACQQASRMRRRRQVVVLPWRCCWYGNMHMVSCKCGHS